MSEEELDKIIADLEAEIRFLNKKLQIKLLRKTIEELKAEVEKP